MIRLFMSILIMMMAVSGSSAYEAAIDKAPLSTTTSIVTIDTLVSEALEHNPELKFYETEIAALKAAGTSAGLRSNPELNGEMGRKTMHGGGMSAEGMAWSVSVVQSFEWPGRIGLRKAVANHDVDLAELGFERFRTALAGRVRALAFRVLGAHQKATAAAEVADRFQALSAVFVQRDPAGLTPLLETAVIEANALTMQRRSGAATLEAEEAIQELNQLCGFAPETRLSIAETPLVYNPVEKIEKLMSMVHANNFELRLRTLELTQQGLRVNLAKSERYPAIAVGPTLSGEHTDDDRERLFGVSISLPLPLWNRNNGNIEAEQARQMQAEVSLAITARDIQRQVIAAALTYDTKQREIAAWRPGLEQQFKDAAELADRHYRLGAVPIATFVELQKHYLEAIESLFDTQLEALEAAVQLELLTGLAPSLVVAEKE